MAHPGRCLPPREKKHLSGRCAYRTTPVDRKPASVGRWIVLMWRRRTKEPAYNITFFGCNDSRCARAARRFLPPAPRAHSGRLNMSEARTTGRPKRTRAHLHAMEPTWPVGVRRGTRGCVLRLSWPPLAQTRRRALRISLAWPKVARVFSSGMLSHQPDDRP